MKKLLATLIVATMLISCMSIVAFAANTATTVAQFPYAAMGTFDDGEWAYSDAVANVYYGNIVGATGKTIGFLNNKSPLYKAMSTGDANGTNATIPETVGQNEYVMVPLIVENVMAYNINVYYDSTKFAYVGVAPIYNGSGVDKGEYVNVVGYNAENVTGVMAGIYFQVLANGIENAEFTLAVDPTTKGSGNLDVTQVAPTKMVVNKTAAATKPEKVTGDDDTAADAVTIGDAVTLADVSGFTAAAGDDAALIGSKANVINNDGDPALYDGTYQIFFGKNDFSGVSTAPAKVGLALYEDGNFKGLYEAKSIISDKWGILFYGLNSSKTYSVKQYVQYDGEAAIIAE